MLIQIHILQNYAPANLNRDDTGSPKDAVFGGQRRGRISSQCLKRSIRRSEAFAEAFKADGLLGVRTKLLPELVDEELKALGANDAERQAIAKIVPNIGRESAKAKMDTREQDDGDGDESEAALAETETKQLIFLGSSEVRGLAEKLLSLYRKEGAKKWDKLKITDITKSLEGSLPKSVDIAMFGRMTTSSVFKNVEAAVQVAHALSANALTPEFDYYTAVDDLSGESGAGMIGDVEFNSSTYYKYVNVHVEKLMENLGSDKAVAQRAAAALLEAAVTAQPSGKQNTFAAHSLPDLILVEVRDRNLPVSYANAFLKPARANGQNSLMDDAVSKMRDYMTRVNKTYAITGKRALVATDDSYTLPETEQKDSLPALQQWLMAQISE